MTHYTTHRSSWVPSIDPDDHHERPAPLLPDLYVPEGRGPIATGLLDAFGRKLFRVPEAMGFHTPKAPQE